MADKQQVPAASQRSVNRDGILPSFADGSVLYRGMTSSHEIPQQSNEERNADALQRTQLITNPFNSSGEGQVVLTEAPEATARETRALSEPKLSLKYLLNDHREIAVTQPVSDYGHAFSGNKVQGNFYNSAVHQRRLPFPEQGAQIVHANTGGNSNTKLPGSSTLLGNRTTYDEYAATAALCRLPDQLVPEREFIYHNNLLCHLCKKMHHNLISCCNVPGHGYCLEHFRNVYSSVSLPLTINSKGRCAICSKKCHCESCSAVLSDSIRRRSSHATSLSSAVASASLNKSAEEPVKRRGRGRPRNPVVHTCKNRRGRPRTRPRDVVRRPRGRPPGSKNRQKGGTEDIPQTSME